MRITWCVWCSIWTTWTDTSIISYTISFSYSTNFESSVFISKVTIGFYIVASIFIWISYITNSPCWYCTIIFLVLNSNGLVFFNSLFNVFSNCHNVIFYVFIDKFILHHWCIGQLICATHCRFIYLSRCHNKNLKFDLCNSIDKRKKSLRSWWLLLGVSTLAWILWKNLISYRILNVEWRICTC